MLSNRHNGDVYLEGEYMIVGRLGKHPKGFVVEPVTDDYVLVTHSGFECSGSMCRTDAQVISVHADDTDAEYVRKLWHTTITPGRVHGFVRVTDNVNLNWTFPVWDQKELDQIKASEFFNEENLRMSDVGTGGTAVAYYRWGYRKPKQGQCYVRKGETRAAGLPDLTEIA